jgi:hypothetical protein
MSFKTLFDKASKVSSLANKSAEEIGGQVESVGYHKQDIIDESRFIPNVDFSDPSSFAHYGSAEEYYVQSIERIYETYPYDGSLREGLKWQNDSSYIDLYIFDNLYPRTNGYALISADGWGDLDGSITDGYGLPEDLEYIFFKGGPHPNPDGMSPLATAFTGSNYYDIATNRENNLKYNLQDDGASVEFWLKKDAFDTSKTVKEIVFDLWNGETFNTPTYGRLTVEVQGSTDGQDPFLITALSGTTGVTRASLTNDTSFTTGSVADGLWHHYAVTLLSASAGIETRFYVDGTLKDIISQGSVGINNVTGSLRAHLGAAIVAPAGTSAPAYSGKMSGSIDEFRYWKTQRSSKDIGRFWFTQVGGGTNTDPAPNSDTQEVVNTNLGVYFKFNEGITGITATDQKVLDYSGRVSNGTWTGYSSGARSTGSAIVESKAAIKEFKDPIIYSTHPEVKSLKTELENSGSAYDAGNNASMYNSIPAWITEEDQEGQKQAKYLTQILSSYFDTLHMQVGTLNKLRDIEYVSGSNKPLPFSDNKLNSQGFISPNIFIDADILEKLADRSEDKVYEKSLNDIKNIIYQNIYNNLSYIYKSKGTEKAFRNLIRCFGIDEELIKLKMYADNTLYEYRDNRKNTLIKDSFVDFNTQDNSTAVVYSYSSSLNSNSTGFIPSATQLTGGYALTLETDVVFPQKPKDSDVVYFFTNAISSSVFGVHGASTTESDTTWPAADRPNFQVYTVRDEIYSPNARFVLTGTAGGYVPHLASPLYEDLYTDSAWNLSVRIKPSNYPLTNFVDGGDDGNYTVVFAGVEVRSGEVVNSFEVSGTVLSPPSTFITDAKRIFLGSHRDNVTGSVLQSSDVRINATRFWLNYLDNEALRQHALDSTNHGSLRPSLYAYPFDKNAPVGEILNFDTLALNWEFTQNTGSNASGEFTVQDQSSGSANLASTRFGWAGEILNQQVMAKGEGFKASSTTAIKKDFIISARLNELETIAPAETIQVLSAEEQRVFKIDSRPIKYYFSFEKSMSDVISQDIINWFGTLKDFNNLIGEPVNRYRSEYKDLGKIRQRYFEKVGNDEIDFNRFYEFYKWFDSSLSFMLGQLVPASADFADNVRTVIESHALERSKYRNVFPFIDEESTVFSASLQTNVDYGDAISSPDDDLQGTGFYPAHAPTRRASGLSTRALINKWKYVHAPVDGEQKKNYLWWKNKAERNAEAISVDTPINNSRGSILSAIRQTTDRESSRPYRFSLAGSTQLGGVGMPHNKDVNFAFQATQPYGPTVAASNIPLNIMLSFDTDVETLLDTTDEFYPVYKQRLGYGLNPDINRGNNDKLKINGNLIAPFSLYETTEQTTFNAKIADHYKSGVTVTNLHHDFVVDTTVPAQGPFTEKFVGGRFYRHIELNDGSDTRENRAEGFRIALGLDSSSTEIPAGASGALGVIPPNYPFLDSTPADAIHGWLPELPTAQRFRDTTAKRPVNIKNILMSTASVGRRLSGTLEHNKIGNYQKNYQVVQTSGRSYNDPYFQEQSFNFAPNPETTATRGRFPLSPIAKAGAGQGAASPNVGGNLDFALPERIGANSNQTIFVNLFSAPGSYEVRSQGYRDTAHEELSVYNALPYRNQGVINVGLSGSGLDAKMLNTPRVTDQLGKTRGLNQLATLHAGRFGFDPVFGTIPLLTYITKPAFHKTNRNPQKAINEAGETVSIFDNLFVQHGIPQSTQQYAWVTASLDAGKTIYGLAKPSCFSASVLTELIESGSYGYATFVGLTTKLIDPVSASAHLQGLPLSAPAIDSYINPDYVGVPAFESKDYLNVLTTMRNGPYGYPTWKQVRTGETKLARKLRESNIISLVTPPPLVPVKTANKGAYQYVRGLNSNKFTNYTEQPVSSRYRSTLVMLEDNTATPNTDNNAIINVSHGNNVDYFSHEGLNNRLDLVPDDYNDSALSTTLNYVVGSRLSTIVDYEERVYPAEINAYRDIVRRRTDFIITDVWDSSRDNRSEVYGGQANSQGVVVSEASTWPLDGHLNFTTTQSVNTDDGAGELLNSYSKYANNTSRIRPGVTYATRVPAGSASLGSPASVVFAGDALWEAGTQSGKEPYESYTTYSEYISLAAKDHSIVPEFRISELFETYVESKNGDFLAEVDNVLSLTGASIPNSSEPDFFKVYSNSDFMKYFSVIDDSLNEKRAGELKIQRDKAALRCNAMLKFLPYKGFYPAERVVELGQLFSASYGPQLLTVPVGGEFQQQAYRTILEPLFSPGILCNTIKSGMAVNFPVLVNTGTVDSLFPPITDPLNTVTDGVNSNLFEGVVKYKKVLNVRSNNPTLNGGYYLQKLPFETLYQPEIYLSPDYITGSGAIFDSGVGNNGAIDWGIGPPGFTRFIDGKKLYRHAIDNFLCSTTEFFTDGPAAFISKREDQFGQVTSGAVYQMDVRVARTQRAFNREIVVSTGSFDLYSRESAFGFPHSGTPTLGRATFDHVTPPYYSGSAKVTISYAPTTTGRPTLDDILSNATYTYERDLTPESPSTQAMQIDASLNLKDYFNTIPKGTATQSKTWLIQSKFETPVLNFANVTATQTVTSLVGPGLTPANLLKNTGMWHQYGSIPDNSRDGIFLSIEDIDPSITDKESLAAVCGFQSSAPQRVGGIKEAGLLEEAVVAIPFTTIKNRRQFFSMDPTSSQYSTAAENLQKYVFPPKFDFVMHKTVEPILMYAFEFTATITKQDIADMWQNLPPDIGERFEQKEVIIEDDQILELLATQSSEVQWMIFKVKKRASKSYEKYRRSLVTDDTSAIPESVGEYSYNWPYDYFSLVELIKVDETVRYVSKDLTDGSPEGDG